MTKGDQSYVLLFPFWPLVFIVVWAIWNSVRDARDEKKLLRSLDWPETSGKVTGNEVVWAHVRVSYEYSLPTGIHNGEYNISLAPVVPDRWSRGAARLARDARERMADFPIGEP